MTAGLCLALAACGGTTPPRPVPAAPGVATTSGSAGAGTPSEVTAGPVTAPGSAALPTSGTTSPERAALPPLGVHTEKAEGRTGRVTYRMSLPAFSGPLASEVDRRVRRSADDEVAQVVHTAAADADTEVDVIGEVTADDGRTVQVRLKAVAYTQGAAHPTDAVSTVVLRRADARPVLLADVLADPDHALAAALRQASEVAAQTGQSDPVGTLTTSMRDWADWQAGPAGMTFSFDDGQAGGHAAGLREVAVPWTVVRPWVRVAAYALLGPP